MNVVTTVDSSDGTIKKCLSDFAAVGQSEEFIDEFYILFDLLRERGAFFCQL